MLGTSDLTLRSGDTPAISLPARDQYFTLDGDHGDHISSLIIVGNKPAC